MLMDGTYLGSEGGRIDPPDTLAGTAAQPITVKALHDGKVTIDAEHTGFAVFLQVGNDWFVIEGINATNGKEAVFRSRANHVRFVRVIAYEGTSGEADSLAISMSGPGIDQVCIDCAAWGSNMRKIYEFSQSQAPGQDMQGSGLSALLGGMERSPGGPEQPERHLSGRVPESGARSGKTSSAPGGRLARSATARGFSAAHYRCDEANMVAHIKLLGALMYLPNGLKANLNQLATGDCGSNITFRDVAAVVGSEHTNAEAVYVPQHRLDHAAGG